MNDDRHGRADRPPVDRRAFIRTAAIASAAVAVSPAVLSAGTSQGAVQWKPAPCNLCGVGCGLLIGIQGGRAVAVKGDPDHPVNRGMACVKGYYGIQALYARDRITRPLLRGASGLAPTTMPVALDLVASRLRDTIQRHGADSVALYGSAQWSALDALVAARLFRGTIGTRNVDTSARLHTAAADYAAVATYGRSGPPGCYEDLDHADVFVLWDVNMAETDPVLFSRILERRRANPAVRIVDLASRTTRTGYAADRALLLAPQSELMVANAVCHEIVARRLTNRDFVTRHVAFRRSTLAPPRTSSDGALLAEEGKDEDWNSFVSFLNDYTPERAGQVSGLSVADIRWLASLYGDPARSVVSLWGANVNRQPRGMWVNNALHNIHLLVGKVASPGNAAFAVSTQAGGAALIEDTLGHRPVGADAATRNRRAQLWGVNGTDDRAAARPALAIFEALERGEIRFLWIQSTNPMLSLPNAKRFRAAAGRDAFIVVSEAYPTPTTDLADVVLPTGFWIERDGISVNAERRIQINDRLIAPPGESMSVALQVTEVARRLGHGAQFPVDVAGSGDKGWSLIASAYSDPTHAYPPFTTLREGSALWPAPGGRETRWRYNATHDPAVDGARGGFDFHGHSDHRAWIWLRAWEPLAAPADREYPFWLSTGSVVEHQGTGTLTRRIPTLHRAVPRAFVEMHRDDARALGIRDGDTVRLTSRLGSVDLEARIDYRGQPPRGRLFAPAFDEGAPVNMMVPDAACPVSGQVAHGECAVRVAKIRSRS